MDEAEDADDDDAELVDEAEDEVLFFLPLRPLPVTGNRRADADVGK